MVEKWNFGISDSDLVDVLGERNFGELLFNFARNLFFVLATRTETEEVYFGFVDRKYTRSVSEFSYFCRQKKFADPDLISHPAEFHFYLLKELILDGS